MNIGSPFNFVFTISIYPEPNLHIALLHIYCYCFNSHPPHPTHPFGGPSTYKEKIFLTDAAASLHWKFPSHQQIFLILSPIGVTPKYTQRRSFLMQSSQLYHTFLSLLHSFCTCFASWLLKFCLRFPHYMWKIYYWFDPLIFWKNYSTNFEGPEFQIVTIEKVSHILRALGCLEIGYQIWCWILIKHLFMHYTPYHFFNLLCNIILQICFFLLSASRFSHLLRF